MKLKELMEELELYERERIPNDIRILGIALYIQTSSMRRTTKVISEFHPISHTAVFGKISLIESAFCSFKQRIKLFL